MAVEADVQIIACQMTMDLFEYSKDAMIEGAVLGGAATYIETATRSDINLFLRIDPDRTERANDMADQLLDVKGLKCWLPILRAKKALKDVPMAAGCRCSPQTRER